MGWNVSIYWATKINPSINEKILRAISAHQTEVRRTLDGNLTIDVEADAMEFAYLAGKRGFNIYWCLVAEDAVPPEYPTVLFFAAKSVEEIQEKAGKFSALLCQEQPIPGFTFIGPLNDADWAAVAAHYELNCSPWEKEDWQ